jgi:hypothetical protein
MPKKTATWPLFAAKGLGKTPSLHTLQTKGKAYKSDKAKKRLAHHFSKLRQSTSCPAEIAAHHKFLKRHTKSKHAKPFAKPAGPTIPTCRLSIRALRISAGECTRAKEVPR